MIRTRGVPPSLRIEVRRSEGHRHVALVDPLTEEELLIAENIEDHAVNELNVYVWSQLEDIARRLRADPELGRRDGGKIAGEIYIAGFAALLKLVSHSKGLQVDEVQEFCAKRLPLDRGVPAVIDVIADVNDHIFFEVMPLLGKAPSTMSDTPELDEVIGVVTGFNAIVRHLQWEPSVTIRSDDSARVSVRFFQHTGLPGSIYEFKQLQELEQQGKAQVSLRYPPKGFRAASQLPEAELVRTLGDPWRSDTSERLKHPGSVCHFSCHLRIGEQSAVLELRPDGVFAKPAKYRIDRIEVALEHFPLLPPEPKLCFLSACRSAAIDRGLLVSAMEAFRRLHPESIVGTLGSVPDVAAALFASKFYNLLADGWSTGAAIWGARRMLVEAPLHNPLGALFISYQGEDVQFSTPADRRQRFLPDEASAILSLPRKG